MTKLENKENVREIIMYPTAYTKCQIGQDWFMNRFEVHFFPNKCYPDYMEVANFIQENIEGKELNIEQAAEVIRNFLESEYNPKKVTVINHIRECRTHFDVDVII